MKPDDGGYFNWTDVFKEALPYILAFFLSSWGGAVHYVQLIRDNGVKWSWNSLFLDIIVSSFAGILSYLMCLVGGIDGVKAAIVVAISGHMGPRVIASFEIVRNSILGNVPKETVKKDDPK